MTEVFLKLMNMSIAAGWLVVAVLFVRLFLKNAPKWISCLLWGIVGLRLLLPFFVESPLSLIPSAQVIPEDIATSVAPAVHSGIELINSTVNPLMTQQVIESGNVWQTILPVVSVLWLLGAAAILLYGGVSYLILRRQVGACIRLQDRVYLCDEIASPFVLGFFRPRIYIPSGLSGETMEYVLLHENVHIRRRDHWWKPLGYCLLAVYWFNPLMWVAYILLCRDIEQSCDEKVISQMSSQDKKGYSQALISCSAHRRMVMVCPVAFGEVGVKTRIKAIVSYKKPTFWIMLASAAVCVVLSVCFLTNPETCLHAYADEVVAQPSCTQMGVTSHTCRLCQYSYTEPVQMCAHSYDEGVVLKVPTCTEKGRKEVTCTACGEKNIQILEKLPHTSGEMKVVRAASCVDVGAAATACTVCQKKYTVVLSVEPDAHSFEETVLRESTCAEAGEGIRTCTLCSHSESVTYELAAHTPTGHIYAHDNCIYSYDAWYCAVCGYNHVEYLGYGNHSYSYGYCQFCDKRDPNYTGYWSSNNSSRSYDIISGSSGTYSPSRYPTGPDGITPVIQIFPDVGSPVPDFGFLYAP